MTEKTGKQPLDTRLLSDAIIELNISRHNVSVYPKNHPIVEKSLDVSFGYLQKLFELREEITLAVAKDTLIIDDCTIDKQNPIYREFALTLSNMNIAYVKFISGLTRKELYDFHSFLLKNMRNDSSEEIESVFNQYKLEHIKTAFIDYSAFNLVEDKREEKQNESLLEKYLAALLEGKPPVKEGSELIYNTPPGKLASLINSTSSNNISGDSYNMLITTYIKSSSTKGINVNELKKLIEFINNLKPELKRQFLASAVSIVSNTIDSVKDSLGEMSVGEVIDLISLMNEQMVTMPKALKNLLDKFADLHSKDFEAPSFNGNTIEDDILLSSDVSTLLNEDNFNEYISDSYHEELQGLSKVTTSKVDPGKKVEIEQELESEYLENAFHEVVLEIISTENYNDMPNEEHELFINILIDEMEGFLETGQYAQILGTLQALKSNHTNNRFQDLTSEALGKCTSSEFISLFIHSLKFFGREKRAEAIRLCEFYGGIIIAPLIDALIDEKSLKTRKLLLGYITLFRDKAAAEAVKRLSDNRWYVQRNMLFIMSECGNLEMIELAKQYCNNKNPIVSFEAIKCLLKFQNDYPVETLRKYLRSGNWSLIMNAISIAGAFKINEVVPDLIQLLRKNNLWRVNYTNKIAVIKVLGQIGDSRALDTLENILSSKTLLYKGHLEKLKKEIFNSLKEYTDKTAEGIMAKHKGQED